MLYLGLQTVSLACFSYNERCQETQTGLVSTAVLNTRKSNLSQFNLNCNTNKQPINQDNKKLENIYQKQMEYLKSLIMDASALRLPKRNAALRYQHAHEKQAREQCCSSTVSLQGHKPCDGEAVDDVLFSRSRLLSLPSRGSMAG
ncbi:hypothetical protein EYF80_012836 [Liparis tanakae]|uniref:Uncharacterized protein n=1 Tax=Liparis tanakae TaxID=230148 RepID=A0A4Z2IGB9_9TELE|nr:hypothetical protein EYF80_012836 [Liparis tanakae]